MAVRKSSITFKDKKLADYQITITYCYQPEISCQKDQRHCYKHLEDITSHFRPGVGNYVATKILVWSMYHQTNKHKKSEVERKLGVKRIHQN